MNSEIKGKLPSVALMTVLVFLLLLGGWKVLDEEANGAAAHSYGGAAARSALAEVALREYEENGDVDGAGEKYWSYWGKTTEAWCVDFLYYCGDQIDLVGTGRPFGTYTAGVGEAWDNMIAAGAKVYAVGEEIPQTGDVVFWYEDILPPRDVSGSRPPMKHLGIVIAYSEEDGILTTVEGNSGILGSANNHVAMNTYSNLDGFSATGVSIYGFARISASGVGNLTEMIKSFEGFLPYPVWDYAQYSVGYGTACPEDKREEYTLYGISEEEAIALLEEHILIAASSVDSYITAAQLALEPYQRDALISLTYNIGAGWMTGSNYASLRAVISDPTLDEQEVMEVFAQICHAGGEKLPGLIGRRMCEAHLMEAVIDALASFFVVSRQAAKMRMVDAGYEEAIGAFTYIDGRYVKPHAFKKGSLKKDQTYCISADDAQIIAFSDMRLAGQSQKGSYIYIDSHMCLNDPKYVTKDENNAVQMTDYARLHIDECCLVFTLKVKSTNKYGDEFYKECVLCRDVDSGIVFQTTFAKDDSADVMGKADAILARELEIQRVLQELPATFGAALIYLMDWVEISEEALAENALISTKMVQRMRNNPNYPKSIDSVVAICIGMHLPPELSNALISRSGYSLRLAQSEAHLMYNFFLNHLYMSTIHECNDMLIAKNLPVMTSTE